MEKEQTAASARIFKNPILEALTKTSPALTVSYCSSVIVLFLIAGWKWFAIPPLLVPLVFVGGILYWTFFEYIMHRYVFHISSHIKKTERFEYIVHGVHHAHPRDEERVFMPPAPGILISVALLGINYLLLRNYAFTFTAGMVLGYMIYAYIHYSVHNKRPNPRFRKLWQHHALHHYKYQDKAFGVSSPLWDIVFNTMPPKETVPKTSVAK